MIRGPLRIVKQSEMHAYENLHCQDSINYEGNFIAAHFYVSTIDTSFLGKIVF